MIILKSIRIRNFRAIKELTFQPKAEGITGIFGPNGAGKSSILTAVLFALYGITPSGITIGALRRIGSENEECSVSVVFTHLGDTIEVIREIKGKNNTVLANVWVNGQEASVTSSSAATKWVQRRLGVKADDFLTAFVVRQKELDAFVKARPSERKAIIERLAGVEVINVALKKAREDERNAKTTLDLLPGSADAVESSERELDYYADEEQKTNSRLLAAQEKIKNLKETITSLESEIEKLSGLRDQWHTTVSSLQSIASELANIDPQIKRFSYVEELQTIGDVQELRQKYHSMNEELTQLKSLITDRLVQKQHLENTVNSLKQQNEQLEATKTSLSKTASKKDQTEFIAGQEELLESTSNEIARIVNQNKDFQESLHLLSGTSECPTCKTHLEHPEQLHKHFISIIEENEKKVAELEKEQTDRQKKLTVVRKAEEDRKQLVSVEATIQQNVEQLNTMTSQLPKLEDELKDLQEKAEEQDTKLKQVIELGTKARDYESDKKTYQQLQDRQLTLLQKQRELNVLQDELKDVFSQEHYDSLRNEVKTAQQELNNAQYHANQLSSTHTESEIRLEQAKRSFVKANEQWDKKKDLQEAFVSKNLTTDMLETFRQETVSSIAPELSDYATDLISDMTGGDFTEIRLDDNFQAYLTDKMGEERPVGWLSGGEESAVALALRLAVAFLITGGNPNLLWLDEPLTAQDKDRRSSILSMIRKLPIDQILIINHAQEAQDIVDAEITLTKE